MMHHLRIMAVGLSVAILCLTGTVWAEAGKAPDSSELRQRCDLLAEQLSTLDQTVDANPVHAQKTALMETMLNGLISEHSAPVSKSVGATSVLAIADGLSRLPGNNPQAMGVLQIEEPPAQENAGNAPEVVEPVEEGVEPPSEAPDQAEEPASDPEIEEAKPAPLPPAPRVQSTLDVKDANVSLVSQLRGLMKVSSEPMPAAVSAPAEAAPVEPVAAEAQPVEIQDASTEVQPLPADSVVYSKDGSDVSQAPMRPQSGGSLDDLVNIDFRDTDLTHVVAILALKANINIIAGADLKGTVTANLQQVPLKVAMETVLRMNGLGIVEEDGIYFIVPYEEAASVNRKTTMVTLENAEADEVKKVLDDVIEGIRDEALISVSANKSTNVLIISAPKARVDELVAMAHQLDVAEPVLPTVTEAINLNYSEPAKMMPLVEKMLSPKLGKIAADDRARHLVVTDMPVVVEQVKELIKTLDLPTKQVLIESMVVEALLQDEADTGVKWLLDSIHRQSRRQAALGENGRSIGNIQELGLSTALESLQDPGSLLTFGVLTDNIDWSGLIQAEVRNRNGRLVSNPVVLTVENEPASIAIAQEIPYIELSQTNAGGSQTNTRFKEVGTILDVTPRVTHDNTILCTIEGKESSISGEFEGVPIEDKREISSTMRMKNGQTIFIGGLRKSQGTSTLKKVPVLGDIPIVNFAFRSNQRDERINDLIVFLTCSVVEDEKQQLTPHQQEVLETAPPIVPRADAWETTIYDMKNPETVKELQWKWRREP